jgi:hypothetical protein
MHNDCEIRANLICFYKKARALIAPMLDANSLPIELLGQCYEQRILGCLY